MYATRLFALADASAIGRVDLQSLGDQTLLELVFAGVTNVPAIRTADAFLDIAAWEILAFDDLGRVVGIDVTAHPMRRPDGRVAVGYLNLEFLPPTITNLDLRSNGFQGTLPADRLPKGLASLALRRNLFSGKVETSALPRTLEAFDVESNGFSDSLDLATLPPVMRRFNVMFNEFTGSVDLTRLPRALEYIGMNSNKFSGSISLAALPPKAKLIALMGTSIAQDVLVVGDIPHGCNVYVEKFRFKAIVDKDGTPIPWPFA